MKMTIAIFLLSIVGCVAGHIALTTDNHFVLVDRRAGSLLCRVTGDVTAVNGGYINKSRYSNYVGENQDGTVGIRYVDVGGKGNHYELTQGFSGQSVIYARSDGDDLDGEWNNGVVVDMLSD